MKSHVLADAGQLFHRAPTQAHSLAVYGHALASHTHALAAGAAGLGLWHIPTVGPFVVILLIAALVALVIVRKHRGPRWRNNRGGSLGTGTGRGPRDW